MCLRLCFCAAHTLLLCVPPLKQLGGRLTVLQRAALVLNIECPVLVLILLGNKTPDPAEHTRPHTNTDPFLEKKIKQITCLSAIPQCNSVNISKEFQH